MVLRLLSFAALGLGLGALVEVVAVETAAGVANTWLDPAAAGVDDDDSSAPKR